MHQAQKQNLSGFTLIEIVLVVALTLFMLTVTVQGFVNSASQFSFANVSQKIEEMVRTARSLAISGKAQIDYTNFDNDTCADNVSTPLCPEDDYVTPANYGVNLQKITAGGNTTYTVTLFADNHSATDEKKYNTVPNPTLADYKAGKDIVLETYTLPSNIQMILPGGGDTATVFFSPIFADLSSDITITNADPFFRFGLYQVSGSVTRKKCSQIHILAGISEPTTSGLTNNPAACP